MLSTLNRLTSSHIKWSKQIEPIQHNFIYFVLYSRRQLRSQQQHSFSYREFSSVCISFSPCRRRGLCDSSFCATKCVNSLRRSFGTVNPSTVRIAKVHRGRGVGLLACAIELCKSMQMGERSSFCRR